jgi:hypothetical protein
MEKSAMPARGYALGDSHFQRWNRMKIPALRQMDEVLNKSAQAL